MHRAHKLIQAPTILNIFVILLVILYISLKKCHRFLLFPHKTPLPLSSFSSSFKSRCHASINS